MKYHKDQANDKDYSHEGVGFSFKKWQADHVAKHSMSTHSLQLSSNIRSKCFLPLTKRMESGYFPSRVFQIGNDTDSLFV